MKNLSRVIIFLFIFFAFPVKAVNPLDLVINEIAWMGTRANSSDEWIELYNNTNQAISLEGWGLYEAGGETLIEPLTGIIEAKSYYLIERTDDTTVSDIPASQKPTSWSGYGLNNKGEHLQLQDNNSQIIDEVNCSDGWFAGEAGPDYKTMERKNAQGLGSDPNNWATNNGSIINGRDAEGNLINGTPKIRNSLAIEIETPLEEPPAESLLEPQPQPEEIRQVEPGQTPSQIEEPEITYPSGIFINELLPSPAGPDEKEEWVEIFNQNNFEVDLSDWKISDIAGKTTIFTFSKGTKIPSLGFLVLSRPTTKITLNNDGDSLNLLQPNGKIIDTLNYEKAIKEQSYNRTDSGWTWSPILTPGSTNVIPSLISETKELPSPEETKEPISQKESEKDQPKKELAAIAEIIGQIQERKIPKSLFIFLIASLLAIFSGITILLLKKTITRPPHPPQQSLGP